MAKFGRKTASKIEAHEAQLEKFRGSFLKTLSEVIFSDELEQSNFYIASGVRRAFDSDAFVFRGKEKKGELVAYSNANVERLSTLLLKAGLKIDIYKIGLSGAREKIFDAAYAEFDNPFPLIGDLTTSAACKKIQRELGFSKIAFSSVETDDGAYAIMILLPDKVPDVRKELAQFALLIKYATYVAALKKKLRGLEERFDEQVVQSRRELAQKEGAHLVLFDEMPIAAALLDERGVITEANSGMRLLFADEGKTIGQPLSSIVREDDRRSFIEFLVSIPPGETAETALQTLGKHFKAQIVSLKNDAGERAGFVVYLLDHTSEINLERELGRTIDALRAENGAAGKRLVEEKKVTEGIINNAGAAIVAVSRGTIAFVSEDARRIFELSPGQSFDDFTVQNSLPGLSGKESDSEVTTPDGKTLAVTSWSSGEYRFHLFSDVTPLRLAEERLGKSDLQLDKVFNSLLPTALVREGRLTKWNEAFGELFADFLSAGGDDSKREKSLDGFLLYLGESPEVCKSELEYNNLIRRTCRTADRRSLNVSIVNAQEAAFIFAEDFTERENAKQQLRNVQSLLTSALESFSEEPIFIVENNFVSSANLAARNKLGIKLDEAFIFEVFMKKIGSAGEDLPFKLKEQFYRLETASLGSLNVYRLRLVNEMIAQQAEINRLRRKQEILRGLSISERYEGILDVISEIIRTDGIESARLVSVGIMLGSKDTAEVYLFNVASGKMEPSLSLSLSSGDVLAAERGGFFSRDAMLNTTFSNVISAGEPALIMESTTLGDTRGFAAVALRDSGISSQIVEELAKVLKAASSSAVGIHARISAERKFEETGKVIRALVGLSGIGEGDFEDASHKAIDLMKATFGSDTAGIYSIEGSSLKSLVLNGELPDTVPLAVVKYDVFIPAAQFESHMQTKSGKGSYLSVKSGSGKLAFITRFVGALPATSELRAILAAALEILETRRQSGKDSAAAAKLSHDSQIINEFMRNLAKSADSGEVTRVLGDSLSRMQKDAAVTVSSERDTVALRQPPGIIEKEGGSGYEANLLSLGIGIVKVKCSADAISRSMVELAVDRLKSFLAVRVPELQDEATDLRARLLEAKDNFSSLRESVEKIPSSLRNARIELDNALSRLSLVHGDEKLVQEIRLHLASAAKEISVDLDRSLRNQDELFQVVRAAAMEQEGASSRIRNFDVSILAEFRVDPATFDLIKDLFVNFITTSGVPDCEVLMKTMQPRFSEAAEGKGKHISITLAGRGGRSVGDDGAGGAGSTRPLVEKLEKLGYLVRLSAGEIERTMDICEMKPVETVERRHLGAILVEDDRHLAEEETQSLLQVFPRVKVASDAVEATGIIESETFGLALVDLSLPSINGRELCRQIKKAQPECVTVLLTNREDEDKSEGVDHIMLRPISQEAVRNYITAKST